MALYGGSDITENINLRLKRTSHETHVRAMESRWNSAALALTRNVQGTEDVYQDLKLATSTLWRPFLARF